MQEFYKKLLADDNINFFFTKITNVEHHLAHHLHLLVTFWEQSLFLKGGYSNNMFQIHKNLHEQHAFTKQHYDIWLNHFYTTIDTYFKGQIAEQMKTNALNMAKVMQIKLN
jgi:hemoglobin